MVSFDLGLGRKVVKCRKVIKCVILRASWCIASRRVRVQVELQQGKCTHR
jgi:hypothetical protein